MKNAQGGFLTLGQIYRVLEFGVRRNSFESFIGHELFKMYKALEFEEII